MKTLILKLYTKIIKIFLRNTHFSNTLLFLSKIKIENNNTFNADNAKINRTSIIINGIDNEVYLRGELYKTKIRINGVGCKLLLSPNVVMNNTELVVIGNNCIVCIGDGSTFGGSYIVCMGNGNYVNIGKECMFAEKVELWASDSHPIFNSNGIVINPSKPIVIGNHVWLGKYSKIMKGVVVGDNSVVGMNSLVTKDIEPNSLNVGSPSIKIKEDINWDRKFIRC